MRSILQRATPICLLAFLLTACSDDDGGGPTGFNPGGDTGIAGLVTAEQGSGLGLADHDFEGGLALASIVVEISDGSGVVFSTATDQAGRFSGDLAPGTYTVEIRLDDAQAFSFVVDVAEGEMLFARAKVQTTPNGRFKINVMLFRDQDGDGSPDDRFRIRIMGRDSDAPTSGVVEVQTNGQTDKIAVCHAPPGNPANAHTIVVSAAALQAHLNHGDTEGPCSGDVVDTGDDNGDGTSSDPDGDGTSGEKVLVCHIPPGHPENARTIEIDADSVDDHLAHGDTEGACPTDDSGDGT